MIIPPYESIEKCIFLIRSSLHKGDLVSAQNTVELALEQFAHSQQLCSLLVEILYQQRLFSQLITKCGSFLTLYPDNLRIVSLFANAYRYSGQSKLAIELLTKTLANSPANYHLLNQLGLIYKEIGKTRPAITAFEQCLQTKPDFAPAYWNKLSIGSQLTATQLNTILSNIENTNLANNDRVYFYYCLFSHYDQLGEFETAFNFLQRGAALKRSIIHYDHPAVTQELKTIKQLINSDYLQRHAFPSAQEKLQTTTPIFIVGLPRSGTTLVEQILSCHPQISAGDESNDFALATQSILQKVDSKTKFPMWLGELNTSDIKAIAVEYFERTKRLQSTAYFTDKTLLNYKVIGLILAAIPNAKVINCTRNPIDNIFSCYKQLFNDGMGFSYQLNELAETLIEYKNIMKHWIKLKPDSIINLSYEELVTDQQQQTAELLKFIGVAFDQRCMEFQKSQRSVHTISANQVKKPMYTSAINQWKNYEDQLDSLTQYQF